MFDRIRHVFGLDESFQNKVIPSRLFTKEITQKRPDRFVQLSGRIATGACAVAVQPSGDRRSQGSIVAETIPDAVRAVRPRALFGIVDGVGRDNLAGEFGELVVDAIQRTVRSGTLEAWWRDVRDTVPQTLYGAVASLPVSQQRSCEPVVSAAVMKVFGSALRGEVVGDILAFVARRGVGPTVHGDTAIGQEGNSLFTRCGRRANEGIVALIDVPLEAERQKAEEPTIDIAESSSAEGNYSLLPKLDLLEIAVVQSGPTRIISTELARDDLVVLASAGFWRAFENIQNVSRLVHATLDLSPKSGGPLAEQVRGALLQRWRQLKVEQSGRYQQGDLSLVVYAHSAET